MQASDCSRPPRPARLTTLRAWLAAILAAAVTALLVGALAPAPVHSDLSYRQASVTSPTSTVTLPRAGGGTLRLGPGPQPHLYLFFATWDRDITGLSGELDTLNRYETTARAGALPPLTAVDEGSVEPDPAALTSFLAGLTRPLSYPVAVDQTGSVADGYEVLGSRGSCSSPPLVRFSCTGRFRPPTGRASPSWPSRSEPPSRKPRHRRPAPRPWARISPDRPGRWPRCTGSPAGSSDAPTRCWPECDHCTATRS